MKRLPILLFILMPAICLAQKKESWWQRGREEQKQENANNRKPESFASPFDESGYYLQKGGSLILGGSVCEILGAGLAIAGASQKGQDKSDGVVIAGGVIAGAGLIVQMVGFSKLIKSGEVLRKIKFTGNGLSFSF